MAAAVVAGVPPGPAETLINELVLGMEADQTDFDRQDDDSESEAEMFEILRQCGVVIAARCTEDESAHLRAWVLGVARATAQARREGGFLGIGSVRVSDDERAAISKIEAAISQRELEADRGFPVPREHAMETNVSMSVSSDELFL
jgi:hypothetical protein